jgi:ABC-type bacteriocin/lantibiotic exporter with double-glycine peptidase domain
MLTRPRTPASYCSLLLAGACAAPDAGRDQVLSDQAVILDVPPVRQDELDACGLAALSGVCGFWGVGLAAERRAELAALAQREQGLSGAELCAALEELGLETFLFAGTLDREPTGLFHQVESGRPVIVLRDLGGEQRHYSAFVGFDEPQSLVCLLDPRRGRLLVPMAEFESTWERCGRFALLAVPREAATVP